jgi:aspartyl protease family protein
MVRFGGGERPPEDPWGRPVARPGARQPDGMPRLQVPARRERLPQVVVHAAVWFSLIVLVAISYGFRHELADAGHRVLAVFSPSSGYSSSPETISYDAASDGQFWVDARADGVGFRFMVDTGASAVVFSKADARRLGFDPASLRYDRTVLTANGTAKAAAIRLRELAIGPIVLTDVPALVNAGKLSSPLLGKLTLRR